MARGRLVCVCVCVCVYVLAGCFGMMIVRSDRIGLCYWGKNGRGYNSDRIYKTDKEGERENNTR